MKLRETLIAGLMCAGTVACGTADDTATEPADTASHKLDQDGNPKADAWDYRNDPAGLANFANVDLEYTLAKLPTKALLRDAAWTDTYWPTYEDSTNVQWQGPGKLSPLQKYDAAFNGWEIPANFSDLRAYDPSNCEAGFDKEYYEIQGPAARWMSENKGNKKTRDFVYRDGSEEPVCDDKTKDAVETWWGLCHAWVPASMNEPEPIYPVTRNGVTFYASDIKALMITVYDSSESKILGGRCNTKDVERDERGRIKDDACRDTNAGSFHVIATNFLGRYNMPIAEDRTYDYQVWNQPMVGIEITQQDEIDLKRVNELLGVEGDTYIYNDKAVRFAEVHAESTYITEASPNVDPLMDSIEDYFRQDNYEYILEMDADGKIIGGEWLEGRSSHPTWGVSEQPDFLWFSTGPAKGWRSRSNPQVSYASVKELLEESRKAPDADADANRKVFAFEEVTEIPDDDPAGVRMELNIGEDLKAVKVKLQLDIEHTYVGDLSITLSNDSGFETEIRAKGTGGSADDIQELLEVADLAGADMGGNWTLHVVDNARIDTGKVIRWALLVDLGD